MRKNIILNSKALPFVPRMDDEKKALAKDLALKFDIDSKKYIHQSNNSEIIIE